MNEWEKEEQELLRASGEVDIDIQKVLQDGVHIDNDDSICKRKKKSIVSRPNYDAICTDQDDCNDFLKETSNMSAEQIVRVQKAEIESLSNQLKRMSLLKQEGDKTIKELNATACSYKTDNDRLEKVVSSFSTSKKNGENARQDRKELESMRVENKTLVKEVANLQSHVKNAERNSQTRELRLKRALQSVEKFKQLMLDRKVKNSDSLETSREEVKDLTKKIKDMEKRSDDMMLLFKKQMQLIDVMKRQKVHLEASRMLQFTEEEFKSVLDWGI